MELLIFILLSIGIVNIIQNENIFKWFREIVKKSDKLYKFLMCPTCFGFWIGVILSFVFRFNDIMLLNLFFGGIISSIVNKIYIILIPTFGEY